MNEFYVDNSPIHGRGCFARIDIKAGDKFECYVLPFHRSEDDPLKYHVFPWARESCVLLCEFTYCNDSMTPNLEVCNFDFRNRIATFVAIEDIKIGEEVTIKY